MTTAPAALPVPSHPTTRVKRLSPHRRMAAAVLASAVLGATLAACGGSSESGESDSGPFGTFKSVEALRSAYVDAGGSCDNWDNNDRLDAATESGDCDESTVLSIYASKPDARDAADALLGATGQDDVLVGANWIVNTTEDLEELAATLGGEVVTRSKSATPTADPDEDVAASDDDLSSPNLTTTQYIAMLRDLVPALDSAGDETLVDLGKASCTALDDLNFVAVVTQFVDGIEESSNGTVTLDEYDAGVLVVGAIRTFCNDHADQIPETD